MRSPGATLHLFADEGHCSLLLKLPEIIEDALDRAGTSQPGPVR